MVRRARLVVRLVFGALLGLAGGAAWTATPATADVIIEDPPKTKRVTVALELDWGVLADRVARPYVVQKGDTLTSIAARHCGEASRWKAIADANPGSVKGADAISEGATLWLPPLRSFDPPPSAAAPAAPESLAPWYDAFATRTVRRWRLAVGDRIGPTDRPAAPVSAAVLVMPHADTPALLVALRAKDAEVPLDHPAAAKGRLLSMGVDSLAHADDPTVRIVASYRITGIDATGVQAKLTATRYDAYGKVVAQAMPIEGRRGVTPPTDDPAPKQPDPPPGGGTKDGILRLGDIPPPDSRDDGIRWPEATGVVVALVGAAVAAAVVLLRRRKSSTS